ncbi:MAG: ribosome small subunit-dependent GTPase A [Rhizobacter sp.]|nr:ribosome small subunit-dependent GTPase A [Rhizobacter sp.]
MHHLDCDRLAAIGLGETLAARARAAATTLGASDVALLRITVVHRFGLELSDGVRTFAARAVPRLLRGTAEALAVGDWVLATPDGGGDLWVHERVAPTSRICRRDADGGVHAIVSNVDHALLVMGLDDDFNPRRLERYLALAAASDVQPLVVLTKADLFAADPQSRERILAQLRKRLPADVAIVAVDATDARSAAAFAHLDRPGLTLVALGSSGAGKSTLTNTLLGAAVQDTGAARVHDGRGMHTTTARSLHRLPGGGCIVDTPGVRTLRPDADGDALLASFADVGALAARCRFRDCAHHGEPGCAVQAGVDADRLRNYHKLLREQRRDAISWVERRQQVAAWKSRGKQARARMRVKRGDE